MPTRSWRRRALRACQSSSWRPMVARRCSKGWCQRAWQSPNFLHWKRPSNGTRAPGTKRRHSIDSKARPIAASLLKAFNSEGRARRYQYMSTKLPEPLATYFAGHDDHDVDAMIGPFAERATVKDEGQERRGLPAIRKWMEESNAKYTVTVVVINVAETAANTTATGRVSGNFPGSPVELRFIFTLDEGKISPLEIV